MRLIGSDVVGCHHYFRMMSLWFHVDITLCCLWAFFILVRRSKLFHWVDHLQVYFSKLEMVDMFYYHCIINTVEFLLFCHIYLSDCLAMLHLSVFWCCLCTHLCGWYSNMSTIFYAVVSNINHMTHLPILYTYMTLHWIYHLDIDLCVSTYICIFTVKDLEQKCFTQLSIKAL